MKTYSKLIFLTFISLPIFALAENSLDKFDHGNISCTSMKKNTHRATFPAAGVKSTSLAEYKETIQKILDHEDESKNGGYHFVLKTNPYSFIHTGKNGDKSIYIAFYGESDSFGDTTATGYFAFMFLELGPKPSVLNSEERLVDFLKRVKSGRLGLESLPFVSFPPHAGQEVTLSSDGLGFSTPAEECKFVKP